MKNFKKVMAMALAVTMVAAPTGVVRAEDLPDSGKTQSVTGKSGLAGWADHEVYNFDLPLYVTEERDSVDVIVDEIYNFKMDPQNLIKRTEGKAFGADAKDKMQSDTGVYFADCAGSAVTGVAVKWSETSDAKTIVNKSTRDVNVKIELDFTPAAGLNISDTKTFPEAGTDPLLYLALKTNAKEDGEMKAKETPVAKSGENCKAVFTTTLAAAPEDAYETVTIAADDPERGENRNYKIRLKDDLSGLTFDQVDYSLTGAINKNKEAWDNWGNIKDLTHTLDVVYTITEAGSDVVNPGGDGPSVGAANTYDKSTGEISFSLNDASRDKTVKSIKIGLTSDSATGSVASPVTESGVCTAKVTKQATLNTLSAAETSVVIKVTYTDTTVDEYTLTVK